MLSIYSLVFHFVKFIIVYLFTGENILSGFPSLGDVTGSAIHLYENMESLVDNHIFYPDLMFSCSGNITKITFIGERRHPAKNVTQYLRFSTWSTKANNTNFKLEKIKTKTLNFDLSNSITLINGSGNLSLYQVKLDKEFMFGDGDVLGVRQSDGNRSKVALLHQIGGGHSYQIELESKVFHMKTFVTSVLRKSESLPLIAIETGKLGFIT